MNSWLPEGGENLFQTIKGWCAEAEAKGKKLIKLSIGQPTGPALKSARAEAARLILKDDQNMHEYQDNGCLPCPDFAQRFVRMHVRTDLYQQKELKYLPIPGIKPMLGLIPLACDRKIGTRRQPEGIRLVVTATTKPGYPTPAIWASDYLDYPLINFPLAHTNFLPTTGIEEPADLFMLNYPHNPSGQAMGEGEWAHLCSYCSRNGIRLFNDAAYAILTHDPGVSTLTDVAVGFPGLSWCEAFSASKAGNFTGWRVGAMVGSKDFISDIATIKGNTDSGINAALAMGALYAFEHDQEGIQSVRLAYGRRIDLLVNELTCAGMQLAVQPKAGFFTLWKVPKRAFNAKVKSAEHFNQMMIKHTGVVGVHFHPYIRYAVVGPVEDQIEQISAAFTKAKVSY